MNSIPNTTVAGQIFTSTGQQSQGRWAAGNNGRFQITKTYAVLGPIANYTFPRFTMSVPSGQTVGLIAVIAVLSAGTVTVDVKQNGTGITGLTAISVSTTTTGYVNPTTNPTSVSDLDYFQITTTSSSSTGDLSVDFVFEITP